MVEVKLSPSILNADFANLGGIFRLFEGHPSVGMIHCDVMDGHFVPNISMGAPLVQSFAKKTALPLDVHLMVTEPAPYIADYVTEGTEYIVVHEEACRHLDRVLRQIKSYGVKCGVALNPATPPGNLEYVFDLLDQVLVMSVNPGFGGQAFIPSSFNKLRALAKIREERGLGFKISVDGGVDRKNIEDIITAGADIVVVGSAVLAAKDPDAELLAYDEILGGMNR